MELNNLEKYNRLTECISKLQIAFNIKGVETFSQNGITTETLVLEYEGSEFVFVNGCKDVLLGWDVEKCSLGENVIKELERDYAEGIEWYKKEYDEMKEDYENQISEAESEEEKEQILSDMKEDLGYSKEKVEATLEEHMKELYTNIAQNTSPLRQANIGPMLVERDSRYIDEDLSYEMYKQFKGHFPDAPFTLPTEDEWEYLCGGGSRSFFRWGDSLDIYSIYDDEGNSFYKENMFGLHIAYNPYRYELIDSDIFVKGGDGGCSLCGGDGAIYVAPCFSSFYRKRIDEFHNTYDRMSKDFYTYRRIIRLKDISI